jgi:hypothetical protein
MKVLTPKDQYPEWPQRGIVLTMLVALIASCSSVKTIHNEYAEVMNTSAPSLKLLSPSNHSKKIVFLIDGLSQSMLNRELSRPGKKPIQDFFLKAQQRYSLARTVFPSLTYPGISSLLTGLPVDQHSILANKFLNQEEVINLESPKGVLWLNQKIKGQTIFSRLAQEHRHSLSLSYSFFESADVHIKPDLSTEIEYLNREFRRIDTDTLNSLSYFLKETPPSNLPDFIFVHLIGVDAIAHASGPDSQSLSDYMNFLDQNMKNTFSALENLEKRGHPYMAILTADHGFMSVKKIYDIESASRSAAQLALAAESRQVRVINQGRSAFIYFSPKTSLTQKKLFLAQLRGSPAVELTALRDSNDLMIESQATKSHQAYSATLHYVKAKCGDLGFALAQDSTSSTGSMQTSPFRCPDTFSQFDLLATFFHSFNRPDAVVLAADQLNFSKNDDVMLGQHGGLTPDEIFVPLLLRNASLNEGVVPDLYKLLKD